MSALFTTNEIWVTANNRDDKQIEDLKVKENERLVGSSGNRKYVCRWNFRLERRGCKYDDGNKDSDRRRIYGSNKDLLKFASRHGCNTISRGRVSVSYELTIGQLESCCISW